MSAPVPPRRITAVEPDPSHPGAVRVLVDGRVYCVVPAEVAAAGGVRVGLVLDAALAERLGRAADAEAAFRAALRALERRSHARGELARRLVQRGHPREAVESALDRAARLGLLDDAAFALHYVAVRADRGKGPARVRQDLLRLGVDRSVVERAIAEHWPEGTDLRSVSLALARKRAQQLGDLPSPVKRRRLLAYLARRGFAGREALDAVRAVLR